jgi:hypothetical protein
VQTGYIRTLELALGWVFEKVPGSEDALGAFLAHDGRQGHLILAGKDPLGAERLQKRWRKSRVHKGIDRILSGETVSSPGHDGLSPSADASDTEADAAQGRNHPGSVAPDMEATAQETPTPRRMSSGHCLPVTPINESPGIEQPRQMPPGGVSHSQALPGLLKLPANHWRLLDIYFSYTHSWLPILQKQDLFQASYLYPEHGLAVDPKDAASAVHAELWAALALASVQDAASSKPSPLDHADSAHPPPSRVYDIARALLPSEHGPFQIHHARAFLLLSLVNLGQDKLTAAALLAGSAIRILLDPDTPQRGAQDRDGLRLKLALMSCFLVDTILSVRCNRPPHLKADDLAAFPLVSENGPDQWEPWTPCDGFGAGSVDSRSSRSSAFCLSTFNQLYAILKVVAGEMALRRQGPLPIEASSAFASQLQQAINPSLQFGSFVVAPTCGNASVPTPYLVRATYLWASALAEPHSETLLPLLHDTLDQYQRLFGRCGTPPFLSACIASFANDEYLHLCSRREVLRSLVSTCSSRRFDDRRPSVRASPQNPLRAAQDLRESLSSAQSAPSNPLMNYPPHIISSLYSSPTRQQHSQPHTTNKGYESFLGPNMAGSYQRPFANPSVGMPSGSNMHMQHPGAAARGSTHHDPPSHHLIPSLGPSPDYDALLADLASLESTDALDPQFMTNLGFAPGCDITEILTRDFGAV